MNQMMMLPTPKGLREELKRLKEKLASLCYERDELLFIVCKNVETEFMLRIGYLEYEVFQAQSHYLRLKRKYEWVQAKQNRQEEIDLSELERLLDEEFRSYQEKLKMQFDKLSKAAAYSQLEKLTVEESADLKHSYREIVKQLHPDLHPNLSEAELRLFYSAVHAYENGDFLTLSMIYNLVSDGTTEKHWDKSIAVKKEIERLKKLIDSIQEEIVQIKTSFPCNVQEFLADQKKVTQQQKKLKAACQEFKQASRVYEERISALLR
ncbi:molecular chaperone DnaJ [Streptococcus sp. H49]|uniref:molecular chaperone DnaJ n=1 Tax=Streptococcus huangxiaojuni TaxID=3237239 RepID=UPI0034A355F8